MEAVNLLLNAPSKVSIEQTLNIIFSTRNEPSLPISSQDGHETTDIIKVLAQCPFSFWILLIFHRRRYEGF